MGCDSQSEDPVDGFILADLNGSWETPVGEFSELYQGETRPYRILVTLNFALEDCADIAGEFQLEGRWDSVWQITDVNCRDWERRNNVTNEIERMLTLSGVGSSGGGAFLYEYDLTISPSVLFLETRHSDLQVNLFRTQS